MKETIELLTDKLHDCLDDVATLQAETDGKVLRSKKQPQSKRNYDAANYATAGARLFKQDYAALQRFAASKGTTVSSLLRQHIAALLRADR